MFANLFSKSKPRVFLNSISVLTKDDLGFLEKWFAPEYKELDTRLENLLRQVITLPKVASRNDQLDSDLGVDIAVPDYESGDAACLSLGEIAVPLWWRPRIAVKSRIFKISSNETVKEFTVIQKMGWRHFFARVFHVRRFFRFSVFYPEDYEFMLMIACTRLVDRMRKTI